MNKKTFKKLFLKAKYFDAELDEHEFFYKEYEKSFLNRLDDIKRKFPEKFKEENHSLLAASKALSESLEVEDNSLPKKITEKEAKSLYKKIMIKVHPDKIEQLNDCELKERLQGYCTSAVSAIDNGNLYKLIEIAYDLNIEVNESEYFINSLKEFCNECDKKIKDFKSTFPWVWANSGDLSKDNVIMVYIKNNFKIDPFVIKEDV